MKISFVLCLLSSVLLSASAAEKPSERAQKLFNELRGKNSVKIAEIVDRLEQLRAEPDFATNAAARAFVDRLAVDACRQPPWTQSGRYDGGLKTKIPGLARRNLDDPKVPYGQKVFFAGRLSEYLAGVEDYAGAEKVLQALLADKSQKRRDTEVAEVYFHLMDLYRWQDRFDDAWAMIDKALPLYFRRAIEKAYVLAEARGEEERVEKLIATSKNPSERVELLHQNDRTRKEALAYAKDRKNEAHRRVAVVLRWFCVDRSPMGVEARAAIRDIDMSKQNVLWGAQAMHQCYYSADWEGVEEFFRTFGAGKELDQPRYQRMRLFARASNGDRAGALEIVKTNLANTALKPIDRVKFQISEALLTGADADKVVQVIAAAKLPHKEEIGVTRTAARQALCWRLNDVAEKLTAKHSAYFVDFPQREMKVVYSEKPIESIADWRAVYGKLDRQRCDRPFVLSLDLLETDVATGRKIGKATELDSKEVTVEISAVADAKGLHIFLLIPDPNARAVEAGFATGVGTEMYFATGKYDPYVCFGTNPRTGLEFCSPTQYSNRSYSRVDMEGKKRKGEFKFESSFTDTDYVQHLFFAWEPNALKLPVDGTKWRFECHAFCPQGAFTLGGSGQVHNATKWCDLKFQLSKKNVTAIRRGLIYRTVKGWSRLGRLDRFDKWADPEIGDPEFYNEVLKPLETELKGLAKDVKLDMSDDDVNRVYEKALVKWRGIAHEIDALRRQWLLDKVCR